LRAFVFRIFSIPPKNVAGSFLSIDFLPVFVLIILLGLICLGFGFVPCGRLIRQALFSNLYQQL